MTFHFDMNGNYKQLVEEHGEEVARQEMARRRSLVKNLGGFGKDTELARAAQKRSVQSRYANKKKNLREVSNQVGN
jgi:hypothetical protein